MNRRLFLIACTLLLAASASAQERGYTAAEATAFRHQWSLDNWDKGGPLTRYVFLNMPEFFSHSVIPRGGPVRELKRAPRAEVARFMTTTRAGKKTLEDLMKEPGVDGFLVLHQGRIVFESTPRMRGTDLHLTMSVSKVLVSALIALLEDRGRIDASKSVDTYLPALAGSGWAGVSVRDILDMASGIDCLQMVEGAYSDPATCYYQFEATLGWLKPTAATADSPFEFVKRLKARRPAGEAYEYTSVNTFVLGWLAEAVTGRPLADLLSTEIWQPMGAESAALISASRRGVPLAHAGLSCTLRDMARFGTLFTPTGREGSAPLISDRHLASIQKRGRPEVFRASAPEGMRSIHGEPARHNSMQWDFVMNDGDFFKSGYGGQGLYVSPSRNLVIAFFGTLDTDAKTPPLTSIARQLATSGLFDR